MIKLNRCWLLLTILTLIVIITASSISVFKELPSTSNPPRVLWQIDLDNFISDIVDDEKRVYVVDGVNAICLNKTNGEEVWRSKGIGSTTRRSKLVIYEDKIYTGTYGGKVTSFSKYTGKEILQFQAPVSTSWGSKSAPQDFFIEDGRLYVFQNGYAVFNATSGELFYETNGWTTETGNANVSAPETDFIFIYGYSRVEPDNGELIWRMSGRFDGPMEVNQDKILLWNYNPDNFLDLGHFMLCIDPDSMDTFWRFDVSSPMYQPTIYNDLVLFGAYDGYFYALDLSNGDLVWKTFVTNQNNQTKIMGNEGIHYPLTPVVSPIQINVEKEIGVWSFAFIQNGWGGVNEYVGNICGIDVSNGDLLWTKPIENNASISSSNLLRPTSIGLVLLNDHTFLTIGSDFYIINCQTGNIVEGKNYDHHLLEPTATNGMVLVAEELNLTVYQ